MAAPDKPAPIGFNSDTWTPDGTPPEPFVWVLKGKRLVLADLFNDADFRDVIALRDFEKDPGSFARYVLTSEADRELFGSTKIPLAQFTALLSAYFAHYDVDVQNLGNSAASSPS